MDTSKRRTRWLRNLLAAWRLVLLEACVLAIGVGALALMGSHIDPKVLALGLSLTPG